MDATVQERCSNVWKIIAGFGVHRLNPNYQQGLADVIQRGLDLGYSLCPPQVAEQLPYGTSTQPGFMICRMKDGTERAFLVCGSRMIVPAGTPIRAITNWRNKYHWSVLMVDP